ncbi:MAG: Na/Pi symporter [Verrucomicrobia bacterium]|nr:Na/Pi symporter [Verrucomicrobiota bacterium]MDA1067376.1 Na/Pi symporter [Verrucomicrobiota bacterium]
MDSTLQSLGGLGLFLFGMALMTSGLRRLAGNKMHHWLGKATRTPISGAISGAVTTALVQSSSATTVATVGFVGAGLLTFPQSLGILFGANLGTTITGWMVAVIGFKLKLGTAALPLLFIAAILYLVKAYPKVRSTGKALAGFALIFLGISYLQDGLAGLQDLVDFSSFDSSGFSGRILLLLFGVGITLVTQSSSATVAASITALVTGMLDLPQAAAVVIGADIGTTGTAALAAITGNTASRRTGFAHVIFNVFTGVLAFFFLPLYLWFCGTYFPTTVIQSPELIVISFHSAFNALGVLVAIPFTQQFGRLIIRMIPERENLLISPLDHKFLGDQAAIEALETACRRIASSVLKLGSRILTGDIKENHFRKLEEAEKAISDARDYAVRAGEKSGVNELDTDRLFSLLHIIDHLERFVQRVRNTTQSEGLLKHHDLALRAQSLARSLMNLAAEIEERGQPNSLEHFAQFEDQLRTDKSSFRTQAIQSATQGKLTADELDRALDGARWLRRLAHHAWRIVHYVAKLEPQKKDSSK